MIKFWIKFRIRFRIRFRPSSHKCVAVNSNYGSVFNRYCKLCTTNACYVFVIDCVPNGKFFYFVAARDNLEWTQAQPGPLAFCHIGTGRLAQVVSSCSLFHHETLFIEVYRTDTRDFCNQSSQLTKNCRIQPNFHIIRMFEFLAIMGGTSQKR